MCFKGEQNRKRHNPQSGQYLHNWGRIVTSGHPSYSTFLLDTPFPTTLRADKDASSFPFSFSTFLHAAANAFTNAIYLPASISAKEKWQELDIKTTTTTTKRKEIGNNLR